MPWCNRPGPALWGLPCCPRFGLTLNRHCITVVMILRAFGVSMGVPDPSIFLRQVRVQIPELLGYEI